MNEEAILFVQLCIVHTLPNDRIPAQLDAEQFFKRTLGPYMAASWRIMFAEESAPLARIWAAKIRDLGIIPATQVQTHLLHGPRKWRYLGEPGIAKRRIDEQFALANGDGGCVLIILVPDACRSLAIETAGHWGQEYPGKPGVFLPWPRLLISSRPPLPGSLPPLPDILPSRRKKIE